MVMMRRMMMMRHTIQYDDDVIIRHTIQYDDDEPHFTV